MSRCWPTSDGVAAFTGALESVSFGPSVSPDVGFGGGAAGGIWVTGSGIELTEVILISVISILDRDHHKISAFYIR
jgi:hypothetical protein